MDRLKLDDVIYANPRIELSGNRMASVSGCSGVSEYENGRISLVADGTVTIFSGDGLEIISLGDGEAVIRGKFFSIEFR